MAFTIKELREMTVLPDCKFRADLAQFDDIKDILPGTVYRNMTIESCDML